MTKAILVVVVGALLAGSLDAQSTVNLSGAKPAPAPAPVVSTAIMHVEMVALLACPAATPGAPPCTVLAANSTYPPAAPPIQGLGLPIYFKSSQLGSDVFLAIPNVTSPLVFIPPGYPPTATDIVTVVYWSIQQ